MEVKEFRKWAKKINRSKRTARKFLIDLGINNKDGSLTENYK